MKWDEVRKCFPSQWVIIEAINAITKENRRIIEEVSVVDVFLNDSKNAMKKYLLLHKQNRMRELYVVHTSCNHLNIEIIPRINL